MTQASPLPVLGAAQPLSLGSTGLPGAGRRRPAKVRHVAQADGPATAEPPPQHFVIGA